MFSRFVTTSGTLFIRTEDLRFIRDADDGMATVEWDSFGSQRAAKVQGTADENLQRLRADEYAAMAENQEQQQRMQQRAQQGLPVNPIGRGRIRG